MDTRHSTIRILFGVLCINYGEWQGVRDRALRHSSHLRYAFPFLRYRRCRSRLITKILPPLPRSPKNRHGNASLSVASGVAARSSVAAPLGLRLAETRPARFWGFQTANQLFSNAINRRLLSRRPNGGPSDENRSPLYLSTLSFWILGAVPVSRPSFICGTVFKSISAFE